MNAGAQDAVIAVAVVAMMLAATLILLSEKELASRWGVRILDAGGLVEKTRKSCGATSGRPNWPSTPASPRGKPRFWRWWPGQERPGHHAGAVHCRGHLQGPHEPHLREVRRRESPRARGAFGARDRASSPLGGWLAADWRSVVALKQASKKALQGASDYAALDCRDDDRSGFIPMFREFQARLIASGSLRRIFALAAS